jgi:hypothetical protein
LVLFGITWYWGGLAGIVRYDCDSDDGGEDGADREKYGECGDEIFFAAGHVFEEEGAIGGKRALHKSVNKKSEWVNREVVKHTPTALPSKKRAMQRRVKVFANDARMPNNAVKKRVALNAILRPRISEPVCVSVSHSH